MLMGDEDGATMVVMRMVCGPSAPDDIRVVVTSAVLPGGIFVGDVDAEVSTCADEAEVMGDDTWVLVCCELVCRGGTEGPDRLVAFATPLLTTVANTLPAAFSKKVWLLDGQSQQLPTWRFLSQQ